MILVAGVNGTGKTTTIGKLARRLTGEGEQSDAGGRRHLPRRRDRAAGRMGQTGPAPAFVSGKAGGDAAGLAFEALEKARANDMPTFF